MVGTFNSRKEYMEENKEKTTEAATPPTDSSSSRFDRWHYDRRRMIAFPLIIGTLLVLCGMLFVGVMSSHHRSQAATRALIGREFNQGFPQKSGRGMMGTRQGSHGHGTLGAVSKIDGNTITIKQNDQDVVITVASDTSIYKNNLIVKQTDIKVGDVIIVRGMPGSNGTIAAKSISIN